MTPPPTPTSTATPAPAPAGAPKNNTKAIMALVLGILSLLCCGFFAGIPAIIVGRSEVKAIDEGRGDPANRNLAQIGWILGLVGTVLSAIGALVYIGIFAFAIMQGKAMNPSTF
ncbi:DUF4190 domain-containing protein [Deltaproteobacteria bacterium PRO3]|nr:DUF4190 domain-containing protein [Deltaproteobacteria bacterium PRO3]